MRRNINLTYPGVYFKTFYQLLRGNLLVNFLSTALISFVLFIYGLFLYLGYNINLGLTNASKDLVVVAFLRENSGKEEIEKVKKIMSKIKVKEWRIVDSETGKKEFLEKFPELSYLFSEIGVNPFPITFEIKVGERNRDEIDYIIETFKSLPSISQVYNSGDISKQVSSIGRIIVLIGMFFSAILFVASAFSIFNSIRLNLVYYKDIIEILRLIGASLSFIKIPFYLLGIYLGVAGGVISIIFLFLITKALVSYISPFASIIKGFFPFKFLPFHKVFQITVISILISLFTTWFSIKSYLK
ncbi:MAG: cell division protein FtsX [Candidatus Aminicenantia bacterium]